MAFLLILLGFVLGVFFVIVMALAAVNIESRSEDERITIDIEARERKD